MNIQKLIDEFLAGDWAPGLKPAVRRWNFLPLYCGWWSILGIRADGSFVRWDTEYDPGVIKPLPEAFLQRLALCRGAQRWPELRALIPERPANALTCEACIGWNEQPEPPKVICSCGGCGWIVPGEPHGEPTG